MIQNEPSWSFVELQMRSLSCTKGIFEREGRAGCWKGSRRSGVRLHAARQGVGGLPSAGHHRPAHPATALGLALVGWLGLEEQREGSMTVAEGRERLREIAHFACVCRVRVVVGGRGVGLAHRP